jgi:hypothetical protein
MIALLCGQDVNVLNVKTFGSAGMKVNERPAASVQQFHPL